MSESESERGRESLRVSADQIRLSPSPSLYSSLVPRPHLFAPRPIPALAALDTLDLAHSHIRVLALCPLAFPALERLRLGPALHLDSLGDGPLSGPFPSLRELVLRSCDSLGVRALSVALGPPGAIPTSLQHVDLRGISGEPGWFAPVPVHHHQHQQQQQQQQQQW